LSITSTFHVGNGFEEGVIDDDDDDEEVEELEGELSDSKEDRAVICRSRKLVIFESRWSVRRRVVSHSPLRFDLFARNMPKAPNTPLSCIFAINKPTGQPSMTVSPQPLSLLELFQLKLNTPFTFLACSY